MELRGQRSHGFHLWFLRVVRDADFVCEVTDPMPRDPIRLGRAGSGQLAPAPPERPSAPAEHLDKRLKVDLMQAELVGVPVLLLPQSIFFGSVSRDPDIKLPNKKRGSVATKKAITFWVDYEWEPKMGEARDSKGRLWASEVGIHPMHLLMQVESSKRQLS